MDVKQFWHIIEQTRAAAGSDVRKQEELLTEALVELAGSEIVTFHDIYSELTDRAYRADLWDAAYIIGCGCGDDGFYDFRGWLIGQGQAIYERALQDPESLVDALDANFDAQLETQTPLQFTAIRAYERKTGNEFPFRPRQTPRPILRGKLAPTHDKKLARFPKLDAKFGEICREEPYGFGR